MTFFWQTIDVGQGIAFKLLIFFGHGRSFYITISLLLTVDISDNNVFSSAPQIKPIYSFVSVRLLTDL